MEKKIPMRKCLATQELCPKKELIRVVRNKEGLVFVDLTGRANGRGAYLKLNQSAIDKAKKSKVLERHLETEISGEIYEEIMNIINSKN